MVFDLKTTVPEESVTPESVYVLETPSFTTVHTASTLTPSTARPVFPSVTVAVAHTNL